MRNFVIGGYTHGNPFDALVVDCYEGDRLLYVSKVRAGFVPHLRREVAKRFAGLETDICPFANLPESKRTQCPAWQLSAFPARHRKSNAMFCSRMVSLQVKTPLGAIASGLRRRYVVAISET